jgi:hypothetical protein
VAQLATNFPESLDNLNNPESTDSLQGHAQLHANVNDAIEAIQAKIGVDGSEDTQSLDYRVSQLEISPVDIEQVQDAIAAAFASGDQSQVTVSYNDALNSLTLLVNSAQTAGYTSTVQHYVKNSSGSTINAGTPVYVSGANGANMLISKASNAGELTSSKTFGLLAENLAQNAIGFVITEGLLSGLDTHTANAGDPVWLGVNGGLVYGLLNKPIAPAHLVFLGIVTRSHAQNGQIFVKVQNGFELNELHDVDLDYTNPPSDGDVLAYNANTGMWTNSSDFATQDYVDSAVTSLTSSTDTITTLLGLEGNNDLVVTGIENKTVVDSFSADLYRTAEYNIQISRGSSYYASKLFVLNDGTNINLSETDMISNTDNDLANITFEESSGIISLCVTPVGSAVTVRFYRTALKA